MAQKKEQEQTPGFEQSLAELEQLVNDLESGELSLEESMQAFEKGVNLTRRAQLTLAEAEQKVQLLMESDGEPVTAPFSEEGEQAES